MRCIFMADRVKEPLKELSQCQDASEVTCCHLLALSGRAWLLLIQPSYLLTYPSSEVIQL